METSVQVVKGLTAALLGVVSGYLGGFDALLRLYVALMIFDFLLGCIKGIKTKNFSSAIALWGFVNKLIALVVVGLCVLLDEVLNFGQLRNISIVWFSLCEGASILENFAAVGVPFPEALRDILVQAKKGFSINIAEIVGQIIRNHETPHEEDSE